MDCFATLAMTENDHGEHVAKSRITGLDPGIDPTQLDASGVRIVFAPNSLLRSKRRN